MSNDAEVFDPTEAQLRALQPQETFTYNPNDLANPTGVAILLEQRYIGLMEQRSLEIELGKIQIENREIRADRETLRIELAKLQVQARISLAEILVGGLLGFSLGIIPTNTLIGVVMFLISVVWLLIMKFSQIWTPIQNRLSKEQQNASR